MEDTVQSPIRNDDKIELHENSPQQDQQQDIEDQTSLSQLDANLSEQAIEKTPKAPGSQLSKWDFDMDARLMEAARLSLNKQKLQKGAYGREFESLKLFEEEMKYFTEELKKTPQECRSRLTSLIHKIPKHRTFNDLLSFHRSWILKQGPTNSDHEKIMISVRAIFSQLDHENVNGLIIGTRNSYVDAKLLKVNKAKNFTKDMVLRHWDCFSEMKKAIKIIKFFNKSPNQNFALNLPYYSLISKTEPQEFTQESNTAMALDPMEVDDPTLPSSPNESTTNNSMMSEQIASSSVKPIKKRPGPMKNEPKGPPSHIYALFTKRIMPTLPSDKSTMKDRLMKVSSEWKNNCSDELKAELNAELAGLNEIYFKKLSEFYASLSTDEDKDYFKTRHKSKMQKIIDFLDNRSQ